MHIFFSGIGGTAIGPLALIAKQAGYEVSGSDKQDSQYIEYLRKHGVTDIHIGQSYDDIAKTHDAKPIDWYVYSSAITLENADAPELQFCKEQNIKTSKRDELLNQILQDTGLKLLAIAGTHGKTTTTAMVIWLFKQLGLPISYSVGAKISFGDMGVYEPDSQYFVYEADEFDRNFLNFEPHLSLISGVSWDHHEIFPTRDEYQQAFRDFINQSATTVLWQDDADYLALDDGVSSELVIQNPDDRAIESITLKGLYNRRDAWLAVKSVAELTNTPPEDLITHINTFPGSNRRMEQIAPGLYSDYAHTPEKIRGAMSVALEIAADENKPLIVVYEPLTNRRQHYMMNDYRDCFNGAAQLYWVPSYLAREDPDQRIIEPVELIARLDDPTIAQPADMDENLKRTIQAHLSKGDMVVIMSGGGGGSLDEWLRHEFMND
ncbi:MAG TPA: Mur ligase domain-containing protein [Candidatus Saccharimonadales bacterium]